MTWREKLFQSKWFQQAIKTVAVLCSVVCFAIFISGAAKMLYETEVLCFGPEQIVGANNVIYTGEGNYLYTNPAAMIRRHFFYTVMVGATTLLLSAAATYFTRRARWIHASALTRFILFGIVFAGLSLLLCGSIFRWQAQRSDQILREIRSFSAMPEFEP